MRVVGFKVCSVFLFLLFLALPAFSAGADNVPRTTPAELNTMLERGDDLLVLDVRHALSQDKDSVVIKGAVRMALAELYRGEGLPMDKNKKIVTYCT
ncbi:MAG: hypothetical protein IME98_02535 [Proteobacteria bacterium]|nr:hypothetical protein [Pseudomonadota bacterium]